MPVYEIKDPNGATLELDGPQPPTEADIQAAFAQHYSNQRPAGSGGAQLADLATQAYSQTAPNIGASLGRKEAARGGNQQFGIEATAAYQNYANQPNVATENERRAFRSDFNSSPVGTMFSDSGFGRIVKTGTNTFTPIDQSYAAKTETSAGQNAADILQAGLTGNLPAASAPLERLGPQLVRGAATALEEGGNFAGPIVASVFPEVSIPTILASGGLGSLTSQSLRGVEEGRSPTDLQNFSIPETLASTLAAPVGIAAPEATLLGRIGQGAQEGIGLASAFQAPVVEQRGEAGQPLFQRGDLTNALAMTAGGAFARGVHIPGAQPQLASIEPASYSTAGLEARSAAQQELANRALAESALGEQRALQGIETGYNDQALATAQAAAEQGEVNRLIGSQRAGRTLETPTTPQSAEALRQQLQLEEQEALRRANQQRFLAQYNLTTPEAIAQASRQATGSLEDLSSIGNIQQAYENAYAPAALDQANAFNQRLEAAGQRAGSTLDTASTPQSAAFLRQQLAQQEAEAARAAQQQQFLREATGQDLQQALVQNQLAQPTLTPIETSPQELSARQIRELDAQRATAISPTTQLTSQADRMREQYARVASPALPYIAGVGGGGLVGAGIGATQGNTPEERASNIFKGAGIGALGGLALGAGASRLLKPELNAGEEVLQRQAKPVPLANIVSEGAAKVEGQPYSVQGAANSITQTAKLPTISESIQQQNAFDTLKSKVKSGLEKAAKAISSEPRQTLNVTSGVEGVAPEAKPGGPAPVKSYSGAIEGPDGKKVDLYHLDQPVYNPDGSMAHPAGSDVSRSSLERLGFKVPDPADLPPTRSQYPDQMTGEEFRKLLGQSTEGEANAIPKQGAAGEVLRPQGTGQIGQLELPSVVQGNAEPEVTAGAQDQIQALQERALKPLPEDTEFLYEQSYNTPSGNKTARYYQVERTPENPRGRTVDEATLRAEGYDTSDLPGATQRESAFAGSVGAGGTTGAIERRTAAALAGGTIGAGLGYVSGDENSDHLTRAAIYSVLGAVGGYKLAGRISGLSAERVGTEVNAIKRRIANQTLPDVAARSEQSANRMVEYATSREAADATAKNFSAQILGSKYKDPVFAKKVGSVVVEERLRGIRSEFENAAQQATTPAEANKYAQQAKEVTSIIGKKDGAFATEADFQKALQDPEVQQALDIYKKTVQPLAEEQHLLTGGFESRAAYDQAVQDAIKSGQDLPSTKLAAPGPNTGTFANLQAKFEDEAASKLGGTATKGNLENPLQRRSRFSKAAMGTAENYETDLNQIVDRMVKGNYEDAAKRRMFEQLEKDSLGVALPLGERPENLEQYGTSIPLERRGSGNENLQFWPKREIEVPLRHALNTDGPLTPNSLAKFAASGLNLAQMAGIADPVIHTGNMLAAIASSPGGKTAIGRIARNLGQAVPFANTVDAVARIIGKAIDVARDTPEIRAQMERVAKAGALRPLHAPTGPLSKILDISKLDRVGRLVLDDFYQSMVDAGFLDTPQNRRDFINQLGQYNSRLMSKTEAILKEGGLSPFIVAGKNFNRIGINRVGSLAGLSKGAPGLQAGSLGQELALRASRAAGAWGSLVVTPALFNYLMWGDIAGPKGTPFGKIALTEPDKNGKRVYLDPAQLTGLRRGLRATGLQAIAQGAETGENLPWVANAAFDDIKNAIISPYAGPAVTAASVALTGSTPTGFKKAKNVTPIGQSENNPRQKAENFNAALGNINPIQGAFLEGATPEKGEEGVEPGAGVLRGGKKFGETIGGVLGVQKRTPLNEDMGELHQAQDARYESNQNRKALVNQIIKASFDENGNLDRNALSAQIQSPLLQQALRENPLEAPLLKNEIKEALKAQLQARTPEEKTASKFTVAEGERAQFYLNKINGMDQEAALQYLQEQRRAGLLTKKVSQQMGFLRNQQSQAQSAAK